MWDELQFKHVEDKVVLPTCLQNKWKAFVLDKHPRSYLTYVYINLNQQQNNNMPTPLWH